MPPSPKCRTAVFSSAISKDNQVSRSHDESERSRNYEVRRDLSRDDMLNMMRRDTPRFRDTSTKTAKYSVVECMRSIGRWKVNECGPTANSSSWESEVFRHRLTSKLWTTHSFVVIRCFFLSLPVGLLFVNSRWCLCTFFGLVAFFSSCVSLFLPGCVLTYGAFLLWVLPLCLTPN